MTTSRFSSLSNLPLCRHSSQQSAAAENVFHLDLSFDSNRQIIQGHTTCWGGASRWIQSLRRWARGRKSKCCKKRSLGHTKAIRLRLDDHHPIPTTTLPPPSLIVLLITLSRTTTVPPKVRPKDALTTSASCDQAYPRLASDPIPGPPLLQRNLPSPGWLHWSSNPLNTTLLLAQHQSCSHRCFYGSAAGTDDVRKYALKAVASYCACSIELMPHILS